MSDTKVKHVLGISGGKDSSALAVYMAHNYPHLDIEYFFTDTGEELPEVYEYLNSLEGLLRKLLHWGKKVICYLEEKLFPLYKIIKRQKKFLMY